MTMQEVQLYPVRIYVPVNGNGHFELVREVSTEQIIKKFWVSFNKQEALRGGFVRSPRIKGMTRKRLQEIAEGKALLKQQNQMDNILDELTHTRFEKSLREQEKVRALW